VKFKDGIRSEESVGGVEVEVEVEVGLSCRTDIVIMIQYNLNFSTGYIYWLKLDSIASSTSRDTIFQGRRFKFDKCQESTTQVCVALFRELESGSEYSFCCIRTYLHACRNWKWTWDLEVQVEELRHLCPKPEDSELRYLRRQAEAGIDGTISSRNY
jgi:hypothetical protein